MIWSLVFINGEIALKIIVIKLVKSGFASRSTCMITGFHKGEINLLL